MPGGDRRPLRGPARIGPLAGAVLVLALLGGTSPTASAAVVPPPRAAPRPAAQVADGEQPQLPGGDHLDPDATRRRADEILAGDEYRGPREPDDTIVERIRRWIGDRVPDFEGPQVGESTTNPLAFLVLGLVVLGAVGAAVWTVVGTRRTRRSPEAIDAEVDVTPLRSADEWAEEAERCEGAGDHRGAVRARYRSLASTLARRGLLADTPGRTAGEQRDDVARRAPALVPAFGAVADLFEGVWFGAEPAGPAEALAARDLAERALAAAPRQALDAEEDDGGEGVEITPLAPEGEG